MVRVLRDHYGNKDNAASRMKTYAKIVDFASRLYGGAIHEMELTTLFSSPKNWAKRIVDVKKQHHAIQKWVKNKEDEKLFINALAEPFLARANRINPSRREAQGSDSGEDEEEDEASGAGARRKRSTEDGSSNDQSGSEKSDDDSAGSSDEKKAAKNSTKGSDTEDSDMEESKAKKSTRRTAKTLSMPPSKETEQKMAWEQWHALSIREGSDVSAQLQALDKKTLKKLANGILHSDGLKHPEAVVARARQMLQLCACGKDLAACGACGRGWAQATKPMPNVRASFAEESQQGPMLFSEWALSEIQSFEIDQRNFAAAADDADISVSQFVEHASKIPGEIRVARDLNMKLEGRERLPRNIPAILKKMDGIIAEGFQFWEAQKNVPS